ncbi:methyltransferase type 12 [Streptomyces longisporoflavus]|uniref:hypothetical protein n=1 Tax=Streptomyces longisporoflavus TaxID=28044 RepID=UPI00167DAC8D|nr:hypothetical protein [Streptomyces longisporoflavus]GGV22494.1 methyltransferase type 12 [Streptomyces longisporoflavus]
MNGARTATAAGKTRFDDIYDRPDPRAYFRTLAPLQYEIPQQAQNVFRHTLAQRSEVRGTRLPVTVLDLCCSYGINAALLNHDLTLADLYAHYTSAETAALTRGELIEADKEFYASRRRTDAVPVIGLDTAGNATSYALEVGLLDEAYAENLERHPPSDELCRAVGRVGLITVTGGIGYITHRTFEALLDATRVPVWVSAFVLRTVPFQQILAVLDAHGLATETDPERTYPQRLFTDPVEQAGAVAQVLKAGEDPAGLEAEGRYYTRLHLSRPRPA